MCSSAGARACYGVGLKKKEEKGGGVRSPVPVWKHASMWCSATVRVGSPEAWHQICHHHCTVWPIRGARHRRRTPWSQTCQLIPRELVHRFELIQHGKANAESRVGTQGPEGDEMMTILGQTVGSIKLQPCIGAHPGHGSPIDTFLTHI